MLQEGWRGGGGGGGISVRGPAAAEFVLGPVRKKPARDRDRGCQRVEQSLLAGKDVLVRSLKKTMVPSKFYRKQLDFIVTSAVLPIFVKSLIAGANVRSLGIVTHCVNVTIRWIWVGTLIYI